MVKKTSACLFLLILYPALFAAASQQSERTTTPLLFSPSPGFLNSPGASHFGSPFSVPPSSHCPSPSPHEVLGLSSQASLGTVTRVLEDEFGNMPHGQEEGMAVHAKLRSVQEKIGTRKRKRKHDRSRQKEKRLKNVGGSAKSKVPSLAGLCLDVITENPERFVVQLFPWDSTRKLLLRGIFPHGEWVYCILEQLQSDFDMKIAERLMLGCDKNEEVLEQLRACAATDNQLALSFLSDWFNDITLDSVLSVAVSVAPYVFRRFALESWYKKEGLFDEEMIKTFYTRVHMNMYHSIPHISCASSFELFAYERFKELREFLVEKRISADQWFEYAVSEQNAQGILLLSILLQKGSLELNQHEDYLRSSRHEVRQTTINYLEVIRYLAETAKHCRNFHQLHTCFINFVNGDSPEAMRVVTH